MTDTIKIYHNPRCSKSRDTLNLLKSNGVEPEVVLYLDTPADAATVRELLRMLGMSSARELMRQKEDLYKTLHLADSQLSEEALIQALVEHPKLMERPIVVANGQARIGRPPAGAGHPRLTVERRRRGVLQFQDLFDKRDRQFSLGSDRRMIELIQRHKQRAHFAIKTFE